MSDIKLNTDTLRYYGNQLIGISGRVVDVNLKLKSLYWSVPLVDLGKLLRADMLADFNTSLIRAANYCYGTADEFDNLETKLCSQNPLDFNKPPIAGLQEFLYDVINTVGDAVAVYIEVVDWVAKATSEAIQWIIEHGDDILEIVCDVVTVAIAVAVIAAIVVGTGGIGLGAVVAIIAGIYAASNLLEKATGFNIVEAGFVGAGMMVGTMCGNSAAGAEYGKLAYKGTNVVVDVASMVTNPGKAATTGFKFLSKTSKVVGPAKQKLIKYVVASNDRMVAFNKGFKGTKKAYDIADKINSAKTLHDDINDFCGSRKQLINGNSILCPGN